MAKNESMRKIGNGDSNTIISMVRNTWQDIHHSRNQDWKFWVILSSIIAGIALSFKGNGIHYAFASIFLALGCIVSLWATLISRSHWILHIVKTSYIDLLQHLLIDKKLSNLIFYQEYIKKLLYTKIKKKFKREEKPKIFYRAYPFIDLSVCGLIFSMYFTLTCIFIYIFIFTFILHLMNKIDNLDEQILWPIVFASGFIVMGIFISVYILSCMGMKKKKRRINLIIQQELEKAEDK